MNLPDMLECLICGLRSNNLNSHITRVHKMKIAAYKEKFPGSITCRLTRDQVERMRATKNAKVTKHKIERAKVNDRAQETLAERHLALVCHECGFESANSLISHITRKHGMKMDVYREKHPGCVVQQASPAQRLSSSRIMRKKLKDPAFREAFMEWRSFPSEIKHWIKKGFSPKDAAIKVSEYQRCVALTQNDYPELKTAQSARNTGSANPMSLDSIASRENVTIADARTLTPCYGRTGKKHPMFGKKHTEEALRKIGTHLTKSNASKPEHEMSCCIFKLLQEGERNSPVGGWSCDYVFHKRKLIVEFFGDFWHHNPVLYEFDWVNPISKRTSQQVRSRDARKIKELQDAGYTVLVIWERDWKNDKDGCMQRIKDAYDRAK